MAQTEVSNLMLALPQRLSLFATAFALSSLALSGCVEDSPSEDEGDSDFISDNPLNPDGDEGAGSTGAEEGGDDGGANEDSDEGSREDGEDAIAEADIIQVEGDRLFALSEYSGLTVVDVSNPDKLKSLGHHVADARPFEMYVEDGQVFAMFNDFSFWEWDEDLGYWDVRSSSQLIALDASDPSDIQERGAFKIPGRIQDSRRIGDILYLVTFEDGYCWRCHDRENTTITSVDISDRANPKIVDQIIIADDSDSWGWRKSVSATTERLYVAGEDWSDAPRKNEINVIDISAGTGSLREAATVLIEGQIRSRWQMDEYDGVLRVISQPNQWWGDDDKPPVIETFEIESSDQFNPLGSLDMRLPRPESLQSVRFDGYKAYAITFERTDPLFTIDLKEPENPRQVGELEIPGWVYHMEPRGDQLLALGFDRGNDEGSINVSLFDVSAFHDPQLTHRIHFGGDWANFAEDQNRIHKAFTILPDLDLIMVPFSGWDHDGLDGEEAEWCRGRYRSGIQLVDWKDNTLSKRGVAQTHGQARRAIMHKDRLLAIADDAVSSFDIANRDEPSMTNRTAIATNAQQLIPAGDHMVRIAQDWWVGETRIEFVDREHPDKPEPISALNFNQALGSRCEGEYIWLSHVSAYNDHLYLVYESYDWDEGKEKHSLSLATVDYSDIDQPKLVSRDRLPFVPGWHRSRLGRFSLRNESIMQLGSNLLFITSEHIDQDTPERFDDRVKSTIEVMDLSDPSKPTHKGSIKRPEAIASGGLIRSGDGLVSWRMSAANKDASRVRFFLEQFDLNGDEPELSESINVPGAVLSYDPKQQRAWTADFKVSSKKVADEDECWKDPKHFDYNWEDKICYFLNTTLHRVGIDDSRARLIDSIDVEGKGRIDDLQATEDRVFARSYHYYDHYEDGDDGYYREESSTLHVFADEEGDIESFEEELNDYWWYIDQIEGQNAVIKGGSQTLQIVNAEDISDVKIDSYPVHRGYWCSDVVFDEDQLYCALGQYGVSRMSTLED